MCAKLALVKNLVKNKSKDDQERNSALLCVDWNDTTNQLEISRDFVGFTIPEFRYKIST